MLRGETEPKDSSKCNTPQIVYEKICLTNVSCLPSFPLTADLLFLEDGGTFLSYRPKLYITEPRELRNLHCVTFQSPSQLFVSPRHKLLLLSRKTLRDRHQLLLLLPQEIEEWRGPPTLCARESLYPPPHYLTQGWLCNLIKNIVRTISVWKELNIIIFQGSDKYMKIQELCCLIW